jgi:hypothetical protein
MSSTMENVLTPSAWCHGMWQKAVERGDATAAKDYLEMYNLWVSRSL